MIEIILIVIAALLAIAFLPAVLALGAVAATVGLVIGAVVLIATFGWDLLWVLAGFLAAGYLGMFVADGTEYLLKKLFRTGEVK